jgi:dTMP kinase
MEKTMKGLFISFEGIEGTGKTIQSKLLCEYLVEEGFQVLLTEEPGGTRIGRTIRDILLSIDNIEMTPLTELLLYNASRMQHVQEVILPAIKKGVVVITDRFSDSTVAYQGYGRGIELHLIKIIEHLVTGGLKPDITILLDLDVAIGLQRNKGINKEDRIELEDITFHKRVRDGYHALAAKEPERIHVLDASKSIEHIHGSIKNIVQDLLS